MHKFSSPPRRVWLRQRCAEVAARGGQRALRRRVGGGGAERRCGRWPLCAPLSLARSLGSRSSCDLTRCLDRYSERLLRKAAARPPRASSPGRRRRCTPKRGPMAVPTPDSSRRTAAPDARTAAADAVCRRRRKTKNRPRYFLRQTISWGAEYTYEKWNMADKSVLNPVAVYTRFKLLPWKKN